MSREFLPSTGSGVITCEPSTRPDTVEAEAVVVFMTEGGASTGAGNRPVASTRNVTSSTGLSSTNP